MKQLNVSTVEMGRHYFVAVTQFAEFISNLKNHGFLVCGKHVKSKMTKNYRYLCNLSKLNYLGKSFEITFEVPWYWTEGKITFWFTPGNKIRFLIQVTPKNIN